MIRERDLGPSEMRADTSGDQRLARAVLAGDRKAAERFVQRMADPIWTACRLLTASDADARDAFGVVMVALQEDGFRRLRPYDGRSRLETFVSLLVRDLLAQRMLRLFQDDANRGWRAFESFFQADIKRVVLRRLPGAAYEDMRRDAYQEVSVALLEDNYRRLRAYSGMGSFTGFVIQVVDRLIVDFIRSFSARRRAPAAVKRLSALDQEVFKLVHWEGAEPRPDVLAPLLAQRVQPAPSPSDVAGALARVQQSVPRDYRPTPESAAKVVYFSDVPGGGEEGIDGAPETTTPEDEALAGEAERLLSRATRAIQEIAATLPEADRLYLKIALGGPEPLAAREVARLMQRPVGEIYKLKQRVLKRLKESLEEHEAVKNWRASV